MKEEGENHLLVPPTGCPYPNKGLILIASPRASMATNQYIRIH
jgi:hypothetical protein